MANPRNIADFTDIDAHFTTYKFDSTIVWDRTKVGGAAQVGLACTLTGSGTAQTVSTVADGEKVDGKIVRVDDDGFCTIQDEGYMTLPGGNGASLTQGSSIVGALNPSSAEGYIKAATTAGIARGSIVDASDATNVVVRLP